MMMVVTLGVYLANIFNIISSRRKKYITYLFFLILIILMGFVNDQIPDYLNYSNLYNDIYSYNFSNTEKGYQLLVNLSKNVGISYSGFRVITAILGMLLLAIAVEKYTEKSSYFYLLYFIFPFFLDVIQVRNFLMLTCIIYASTFLFECNLKNIISYYLLVYIGASFQVLGYIFFIVPLFLLFDKTYLFEVIFLIIILIASIIMLYPPVMNNIMFFLNTSGFSSFGSLSKIQNYLNQGIHFGFLLYWLAAVCILGVAIWNRRYMIKNGINSKDIRKVKIISYFTISSFIVLPFFVITLDFFRAVRDIFPLVILSYIITNTSMRRASKIKIIHSFVFVLFILILFILFIASIILKSGVIPILMNNTLL